jgi:hypothetical protein
MSRGNLIEGRSNTQAICLACEALERDRTADARTLHAIALRCTCGCVTPETVHELARGAFEDALLALVDYVHGPGAGAATADA